MPQHFRVEMLPAGYGDALWIEYGTEKDSYRILVDGGLSPTYDYLHARLQELPYNERTIELVVCSHIDLDHISGLLKLFKKPPEGLRIGDVWFNGWKQIKGYGGILGAGQGEDLDAFIGHHKLRQNDAFGGKAVVVPDVGSLPVIDLPGGMKVTILGPSAERLRKLVPVWKDYVEGHGGIPGEAGDDVPRDAHPIGILGTVDVATLASQTFKEDKSVANGSSIVMMLEWEGKSVLLTGDALPSDVMMALKRWNQSSGMPMARVGAFKLSHHGGSPNTSPDLLRYVNTDQYLISTNGVSHGHPTAETIARILVHGPKISKRHLHFNYRTEYNQMWDDKALMREHNYRAFYPAAGSSGAVVTLL